jgi:uncharacterized RDD family membrane protein YckC
VNKQFAGLQIRAASFLIDQIILFTPLTLIVGALHILLAIYPNIISTDTYVTSNVFMSLYKLNMLIEILYFAFLPATKLQGTLGYKAVGIKVTDYNNMRISYTRALWRYIATFLSILSGFVGFLMIALTKNKQALHDILARTYVIYQ